MDSHLSFYVARTRDGLFRCGFEDQRLLWVNQGFADRFAFPADPTSLVGRRLPEIVRDNPFWVEAWHRLRETGEVHDLTGACRLVGEQECWVGLEACLTGPAEAPDTCVEGCLRDLTERHRQEDEATRQMARIQDLVARLGLGVILVDPDDRISLWNPTAADLTGWPTADALGRPLSECLTILREDGAVPLPDPTGPSRRFGRPCELAWPSLLVTRKGRRRRIMGRIDPVPMPDAAGTRQGAAIVFQDITLFVRSRREIEKARRLDTLSLLAGGIAHDFNNIMTGLFGYIGLAQADAPPGSRLADRLAKAESALSKARGLSNQLLTFARARPPQKRAVSLADFLRQEVQTARLGTALTCEFDLAPDLCPVDLDEVQFAPVIHALVAQAGRSQPAGGVLRVRAGNLWVDATEGVPLPEGRHVVVTFEDQGDPLSEATLDRLFEPYAVPTPTTGEGFDLPLAYAIVKNHGGWLTALAGPTGGTIFRLYLPASVLWQDDALSSLAVEQLGAKVLLMDDEEIILAAVGEMLQHLGCMVELARDGDEAIEKFRQAQAIGAPFDVVILDLTVPGGKGARECLPHLLALDPQARVVVASGYSTGPVMTDYQRFGFVGAIPKPFEVRSLGAFLRHLLGSRAWSAKGGAAV
ncbi:MAG: PAS/PAC sensor hybrid histidine kinase [Candidatus Ozemobacter sibiricus]|uniref:histidine kinase n=1 Tax=Candidatus Ozemobacter sibiricus TaxID=2268124 RepID=A0A367ZND1_9BACT|nr:MAG: PAS/PAC sensor hybrid histidine kinase [Candidatus Ozemobacter sibiricus]